MAPQSPAGTPRGGKLQRRNTPQLLRTGSYASTIAGPPKPQAQAATMSPKVTTPGTMSSQNWPLPPPPKIPASSPQDYRPNTSDGVVGSANLKNASLRPPVHQRAQSGLLNGQIAENDAGTFSEQTGRKKRFGKLRKAFGLHD